jgi:hypothetical protein
MNSKTAPPIPEAIVQMQRQKAIAKAACTCTGARMAVMTECYQGGLY